MQRYFVPLRNWDANIVRITDEDAHHINRVMRKQAGDEVVCSHPSGQAAHCVITDVNHNVIELKILAWLKHDAELPIKVTIAQGLPKSDKLDWIIQKGTELGAEAFIPCKTDRSVVKWDDKKMQKKLNRMRKIAKEASEQSHRNKVPILHEQMNITALISYSRQFDLCIFAYEEEAKVAKFNSFSTMIKEMKKDQSLLVCIGPEGGFTIEEAAQLKENGFHSVRLGPRILRTETVAMYILSGISYQFEG